MTVMTFDRQTDIAIRFASGIPFQKTRWQSGRRREATVMKIMLAMIWTLSVVFAVGRLPAATRPAGITQSADTARIDVTVGYSQARVLEPGSRGSVVEI